MTIPLQSPIEKSRSDGPFGQTDMTQPIAPFHYIEEAVRVYLRLSDDGLRWVIDRATVDGGGLYSDYDDGPEDANCECPRDDHEHLLWLRNAESLELPSGEDLLYLLAEALGKEVRDA